MNLAKKRNKRRLKMKTKVKEIGEVCVYCGSDYGIEDYEVGCCGEVHHELGYESVDEPIHLVLESELNENYEVVE
jgi:hypothetical protein